MIEPRGEQVDALGPAAPCRKADPLASPGSASATTTTGAGGKSASTSPAPSVVIVDAEKSAWIGIELKDRKKRPVPGAAWEVLLPNGRTITGALDRNGKTRIEGIDPGQCRVTFPALDRREFL